jgi:hypothetical protein
VISRRLLLRLLATVALVALVWVTRRVPESRPAPPADTPVATNPAPPAGPEAGTPHPEIGFHDADRLAQHFRKHGAALGVASAGEYLRRAQALRDRPVGGALLESVRADGVVTRFDRATGAFLAFDRDLTIRTFFRPNDGERYFARQLARGRSE